MKVTSDCGERTHEHRTTVERTEPQRKVQLAKGGWGRTSKLEQMVSTTVDEREIERRDDT